MSLSKCYRSSLSFGGVGLHEKCRVQSTWFCFFLVIYSQAKAAKLQIEQSSSHRDRWVALRTIGGGRLYFPHAPDMQEDFAIAPETNWGYRALELVEEEGQKKVMLIRIIQAPDGEGRPPEAGYRSQYHESAFFWYQMLTVGEGEQKGYLPRPHLLLSTLVNGQSVTMSFNPSESGSGASVSQMIQDSLMQEGNRVIEIPEGLAGTVSSEGVFPAVVEEMIFVFLGGSDSNVCLSNPSIDSIGFTEVMLHIREQEPARRVCSGNLQGVAKLCAASLHASGYLGGSYQSTQNSDSFQGKCTLSASEEEKRWVSYPLGRLVRFFIDPLPSGVVKSQYAYPAVNDDYAFNFVHLNEGLDFTDDNIYPDCEPVRSTHCGYKSSSGLRFVVLQDTKHPDNVILAFSCAFASNHGTSYAGLNNLYFNVRQVASCGLQMLGCQPEAFEQSRRVTAKVIAAFPLKKVVVTGYCYGGALATVAGLQNGVKTVVFNPFPVGCALQRSLGSLLARANQLVSVVSVEQDWASDLSYAHSTINLMDRFCTSRPRVLGRRCFIKPARDSYNAIQRHLRLRHSFLMESGWRCPSEKEENLTSSSSQFPPFPPSSGAILLQE